jgi:hypothetical protein
MNTNRNSQRLRELIESAGLTQEAALLLFNTSKPPIFKPYSLSAWKAFLCDPETTRYRAFGDLLLQRAEKVFGGKKKKP